MLGCMMDLLVIDSVGHELPAVVLAAGPIGGYRHARADQPPGRFGSGQQSSPSDAPPLVGGALLVAGSTTSALSGMPSPNCDRRSPARGHPAVPGGDGRSPRRERGP